MILSRLMGSLLTLALPVLKVLQYAHNQERYQQPVQLDISLPKEVHANYVPRFLHKIKSLALQQYIP